MIGGEAASSPEDSGMIHVSALRRLYSVLQQRAYELGLVWIAILVAG